MKNWFSYEGALHFDDLRAPFYLQKGLKYAKIKVDL